MNNIYRYLQKKHTGTVLGIGIGPYSKYMIDRGKGIKKLPNINRESWNYNFNKLIFTPMLSIVI